MPGFTKFIAHNPLLRFALAERSIRAVSGIPGVITDGEYDLETLGAAALDASAAVAILGVKTAMNKIGQRFLVPSKANPEILISSSPHIEDLAKHKDVLYLVLNMGVAALEVIDLANGAGAPDEGADFLIAAQLLDPVGSGLAAARPDAGRWAGAASDGYADSNSALLSTLDDLRELDKQMQQLMARQADAVQKAHLTVAGGMNTLILCYPIAWQIGLSYGFAATIAFQIAAVTSVLGGVATMEYFAVQESSDVGQLVDGIAEQYGKLFSPGSPSDAGAVAAPTSAGSSIGTAESAPQSPATAQVPTVAALAARAGGERAERLHSLLNLLAAGPTPDAEADTDTEFSGGTTTIPANPAPPTGGGAAAPRSAAQPGRGSTGAAPTSSQQRSAEAQDETAHPSDATEFGAAPGDHRTGTAPVGLPAGDTRDADQPIPVPRGS